MPMPALLARRHAKLLAAAAVVVVVITVVSAVGHRGSPGHSAMSRGVSVKASEVTAVDLEAVPGHLSVVSTASGSAALTGVLDWTGQHAPSGTTRLSGHRLSLSYKCAQASPCTADWRLVVPRRAAVALHVSAGYVLISGLAGPLQITASSADISATGLACSRLDATITSGHLGAVFRAPPEQVAITLTSAQSTVKLPADVAYAVSDHVTAGYMKVGIPESGSSRRTVTVAVLSGELALLPA